MFSLPRQKTHQFSQALRRCYSHQLHHNNPDLYNTNPLSLRLDTPSSARISSTSSCGTFISLRTFPVTELSQCTWRWFSAAHAIGSTSSPPLSTLFASPHSPWCILVRPHPCPRQLAPTSPW